MLKVITNTHKTHTCIFVNKIWIVTRSSEKKKTNENDKDKEQIKQMRPTKWEQNDGK